jgi:hypothetical protein
MKLTEIPDQKYHNNKQSTMYKVKCTVFKYQMIAACIIVSIVHAKYVLHTVLIVPE